MLKKIYRGLGKKDYQIILSDGVASQTPLFGVRFIRSEETKVGWIVSKKISTRAVDRNRIKRRLSEVVSKQMMMGKKVVILAKKSLMGSNIKEITSCWKSVCEKNSVDGT